MECLNSFSTNPLCMTLLKYIHIVKLLNGTSLDNFGAILK